MTERGGGPPPAVQPGGAQYNTVNKASSSASKRFVGQDQRHPYQENQQVQRKQSSIEQRASGMQQSATQNFGAANAFQPTSNSGSTNNSSAVHGIQPKLQVGSDFKMMNLTQQQISVSKMIQTRDSEAARRAHQMSKQVQSNTMSVRDQIARIQQQVQMQKEKSAKAQADAAAEQLLAGHHAQAQSQSIQMHGAMKSQNQQFNQQQQHQYQQQQQQERELMRNPLSGTIQMNVQNSRAKPVQNHQTGIYSNITSPQPPFGKGGVNPTQIQQVTQQLHGGQVASDHYLTPAPQASQQFPSYSNVNGPSGANPNPRKANQSELVVQKHMKSNTGKASKMVQHNFGQNQLAPSANQSASTVVRKGKNQQPRAEIDYQTAQQQNIKSPQSYQQREQHSLANTNQEQGQLQISKKNTSSQIDSNRHSNRAPNPSQLSNKQSVSLVRPSAKDVILGGNSRRQKVSSLGISNLNVSIALTGGNDQNIMPAQQSNISAEDLDDDEGRTKEIPRQSVLSNLVESSISNFEEDKESDDGEEEDVTGLDNVVNTKNNIRIQQNQGAQHHNNLKSRKSQKEAKRKREPYVVNRQSQVARNNNDPYLDKSQSVHSKQQNKRKDIDSDNKSEVSDESTGVHGGGRHSSILRRKKVAQPMGGGSPEKQGSQHRSSQSRIEVRGVETIEEFFRPEFAQNTQSLDGIMNDDSDKEDRKAATQNKKNRASMLKHSMADEGQFPQFSDNSSLSDNNSQVDLDISKDDVKDQFRGMGFPNMNYLDPDAKGPAVQNQTYYKNFVDNNNNDVKNKREELSKAPEQLPNNTFTKLFHFLNADAGDGQAAGGEEERDADAGYNDRDDNRDSGFPGPRGNKQDELQSIQYIDQNYVESSMETDNEAAMANFQREICSPNGGDVRIIYNPAKNKSKSLGRVGLADQLNQFHSLNKDGRSANPNSQLRQRKSSMNGQDLRGGISDGKMNHSHGRRQRIKANSSEKLPPLIINDQGSASRKRLLQPPDIESQSRQKMHGAQDSHIDSQHNIFLKQALGPDLVPINFEMKQRSKQQMGEVSAKARLNGNLTTITGGSHQQDGQMLSHQRAVQEKHLKSSSNPSLHPQSQGRSGSVNAELVQKHSISVSNQGATTKHSKKGGFSSHDHNLYHHNQSVGGGFLSPQQATSPGVDQDSNLPPILKNQENYFTRNGAGNQIGSGQNERNPSNEANIPQPVQQKHFGMMHKRIDQQNQLHGGVFSAGNQKQQAYPNNGTSSMQQVSVFQGGASPKNSQALQQPSPQNQQVHQTSQSPQNRNAGGEANQQFFSNSEKRRAPIKAFATPSNASVNAKNSATVEQDATNLQAEGEDEMQEFVDQFERATHAEKAHEQLLSLKKIRLHHKVLSKISFNAYKFVIDFSQIIKVHKGQTLFVQGSQIDQIYFVLYGGLMVTIQNSNNQRVGDTVRGGNVLGEEAFFKQNPTYKETAVGQSDEVGLLAVDAVMLSGLGSDNFQGKGQNMLAYQRDFRALFQVLKEIFTIKEAWRARALNYLSQQAKSNKTQQLGRKPPQ